MRRTSYHTVGARPYMEQAAPRRDYRFFVFSNVFVVVVLLISIYANFFAPPCTGTVTGKGYHTRIAGAFPGQPGSELVYYIKIADDNGRQWWSWYVSENVYHCYDEGDRLCFFGKIKDASAKQGQANGRQ